VRGVDRRLGVRVGRGGRSAGWRRDGGHRGRGRGGRRRRGRGRRERLVIPLVELLVEGLRLGDARLDLGPLSTNGGERVLLLLERARGLLGGPLGLLLGVRGLRREVGI